MYVGHQLLISNMICIFFFFAFLGPHLWHKEVPRLEVKLKLHLPAYSTATVLWNTGSKSSGVCNLHHNLQQCLILNPLNKARGQTCVLMDTTRVCYRWATTATPANIFSIQLVVWLFILLMVYFALQSFFFFHFQSVIKVQLMYNVVITSAVQQSDLIIHINIAILLQILFLYRLPQTTG